MEVHPAQRSQQIGQTALPIEVGTIAGDILGDDHKLPDAALSQTPGLFQQGLHGPAAVSAPQVGDDAVGTAVVTALRDLQIGCIGGRRD